MLKEFMELLRDFFDNLFHHKPTSRPSEQWETFPVYDPKNVEEAVRDLKGNGWTIHSMKWDEQVTYILAFREQA